MLFLLSNLKKGLSFPEICSQTCEMQVHHCRLTSCLGRKDHSEWWKEWRPSCCQTKSLREKKLNTICRQTSYPYNAVSFLLVANAAWETFLNLFRDRSLT